MFGIKQWRRRDGQEVEFLTCNRKIEGSSLLAGSRVVPFRKEFTSNCYGRLSRLSAAATSRGMCIMSSSIQKTAKVTAGLTDRLAT